MTMEEVRVKSAINSRMIESNARPLNAKSKWK